MVDVVVQAKWKIVKMTGQCNCMFFNVVLLSMMFF